MLGHGPKKDKNKSGVYRDSRPTRVKVDKQKTVNEGNDGEKLDRKPTPVQRIGDR